MIQSDATRARERGCIAPPRVLARFRQRSIRDSKECEAEEESRKGKIDLSRRAGRQLSKD
jgi:hypothetical protein